MRCWRGYLSGARWKWLAHGPADASAIPSSLGSLKSRMVSPFWCQLTQVVLEKKLLNGCLSVKPRLHDTTGCQTGLTTGWMCAYTILPVLKPVVTNIQLVVKPIWQPAVLWTNSGCSFNTVVKPVWQPVGCLFTRYSLLSNRLYNRLYRVNGVLVSMYYEKCTITCLLHSLTTIFIQLNC